MRVVVLMNKTQVEEVTVENLQHNPVLFFKALVISNKNRSTYFIVIISLEYGLFLPQIFYYLVPFQVLNQFSSQSLYEVTMYRRCRKLKRATFIHL